MHFAGFNKPFCPAECINMTSEINRAGEIARVEEGKAEVDEGGGEGIWRDNRPFSSLPTVLFDIRYLQTCLNLLHDQRLWLTL